MKNTIQLIILTLVLSIGAFAQIDTVDGGTSFDSIVLSGDETRTGTFDEAAKRTIGNSVVMNGSNRSYSAILFTFAFDYDGIPDFAIGNPINQGSWNIAIYTADGGYRGSIFGSVKSGSISWSVPARGKGFAADGEKFMDAYLEITGSTGDFKTESFPVGSLMFIDSRTTLQSSTVKGTLKGLPI
jgi:hypothetical protein